MKRCRTNLNLRFVEVLKGNSLETRPLDEEVVYTLQRKTLFGWKTFVYAVGGSPAGIGYGPYHSKSKDELLDTVLRCEYNTSKEYCHLTIHPTVIEIR